jgi:hypothetical protein
MYAIIEVGGKQYSIEKDEMEDMKSELEKALRNPQQISERERKEIESKKPWWDEFLHVDSRGNPDSDGSSILGG